MDDVTAFACKAYREGYMRGYGVESPTEHDRRTAAWMCSQWLNVNYDKKLSQEEIYEVMTNDNS